MARKPHDSPPAINAQSDNSDEYQIGYGRPPKSGQFQKGVSGNRRGRPKGAKSLESLVREGLAKKVEVKVDGKLTTLTLAEAVVTRTLREAAGGNRRAVDQSLRLMDRYAPSDRERPDDYELHDLQRLSMAELDEFERLSMKAQGREEEYLTNRIKEDAAALARYNAMWESANVPFDNSNEEICIYVRRRDLLQTG